MEKAKEKFLSYIEKKNSSENKIRIIPIDQVKKFFQEYSEEDVFFETTVHIDLIPLSIGGYIYLDRIDILFEKLSNKTFIINMRIKHSLNNPMFRE